MVAPYHGVGGPIPIRRVRDDELLPTQRAFVAACRALGFPAVADHNAPGASGIGPPPLNVRDGVRISTAIAYLLPARGRSNLTIRPRCLVDRVLLDGTRAVGLAVAGDGVGAHDQVRGRRITLAAGAIGSQSVAGCTAPGSVEPNDLQLALMMNSEQPASTLLVCLMRPRSRGVPCGSASASGLTVRLSWYENTQLTRLVGPTERQAWVFDPVQSRLQHIGPATRDTAPPVGWSSPRTASTR